MDMKILFEKNYSKFVKIKEMFMLNKFYINFYFIISAWFPHGNSNLFICKK